ncbi:MAG: NAD-dependent epimerase/dehydratase family protein [Clostridiales bacterium]
MSRFWNEQAEGCPGAKAGKGREGLRVLLTGEQGYIVNCLEKWLELRKDLGGKAAGSIAEIKKISLRGEAWQAMDFSGYDCIVHLAGLAHGREKEEGADFAVINTELTRKLGEKAQKEGVSHFVFISTMAVYGVKDSLEGGGLRKGSSKRGGKQEKGPSLGQPSVINENTPLAPFTAYGKSKLAAEQALAAMAAGAAGAVGAARAADAGEGLALALVRPPMVYGPDCPGNYQSLRKLILKVKVFPRYDNARSMIFIDNLCELIRLVIVNRSAGVFTPQNREYVKTWQMAEAIARNNGVNIWCSALFNPMIKVLGGIAGSLPGRIPAKIYGSLAKAFGSLVYDQSMSEYFDNRYCVCDYQESMRRTERAYQKNRTLNRA